MKMLADLSVEPSFVCDVLVLFFFIYGSYHIYLYGCFVTRSPVTPATEKG